MPYLDAPSGGHRRRPVLPEALLVVTLSLLAAWILRTLAPPSLVRDGQRLPVGIASQHNAVTGHHGSAVGGPEAPSPVSDEPVPHFLGVAFLAAHLLAVALAVGVPLIPRLLARLRLHRAKFAAQLLFAALVGTVAGGALVLAARLGYGDRIALREAVTGGVDMARYAFVAALAVVVIFGFPLTSQQRGVSRDRSGT